jgi:hypothetical protein
VRQGTPSVIAAALECELAGHSVGIMAIRSGRPQELSGKEEHTPRRGDTEAEDGV